MKKGPVAWPDRGGIVEYIHNLPPRHIHQHKSVSERQDCQNIPVGDSTRCNICPNTARILESDLSSGLRSHTVRYQVREICLPKPY